MTEPSEPDQSIAAAIQALRHDILSDGRHMAWDDVRGRIRTLIGQGRPSPHQRLQLLELYDIAVTMVGRRLRPDLEASRRLGYQRANDTMLFLIAEVRDHGGSDVMALMATIIDRELDVGRMRRDRYLANLLSWITHELDKGLDGGDGARPPGVQEEAADFRRPAQPPSRQPAFSTMALKNSGS